MSTLQHNTVNLRQKWVNLFWKVNPHRRIHADFAQRIVIHVVHILFVPLLLFPQSLQDFQELILFDTAFKVDPIHGQKVLDLLGAQLVEIFQSLNLVKIDQTMVGKSSRTAW